MKKNGNVINVTDIHDNDCRVIFDGSLNDIPLKLGKRYRGSGCFSQSGDFYFRRYSERPMDDNENVESTNKVAEQDGCTIYEYKDKYKITIDIKKKKLDPQYLFLNLTRQIDFMNKFLFHKNKR